MLWVVLFALPVVKMALVAVFLVFAFRSNRDPGEEIPVPVSLGDGRRRPPSSRPRRGPTRGGPARRALSRRARAAR